MKKWICLSFSLLVPVSFVRAELSRDDELWITAQVLHKEQHGHYSVPRYAFDVNQIHRQLKAIDEHGPDRISRHARLYDAPETLAFRVDTTARALGPFLRVSTKGLPRIRMIS